MTIRVVCPGCRAAYTVAEDLRGKKARCRECKTLFLIGAVSPTAGGEPVKVELTEEATPPVPQGPPPAAPTVDAAPPAPPPVVVVEEVIETVERASPRPAPVRARRVADEEDEEEDRPRSKKPKKARKSGTGLVVTVLVGGMVISVGAVVAAFMALSSLTKGEPEPTQPVVVQGPGFFPGAPQQQPDDDLRDIFPDEPKAKNLGQDAVLDPPLPNPAVEAKSKDGPPPSSDGQLDPDVLKRVKAATVFLKVTFASGQQGQGSGFFAIEKGFVLTNAHVLGMLEAGSGKPKDVDVVINSGQPDEQKVKGIFVDADRHRDLAVLKVTLKDQPPPLAVKSSRSVFETQKVYVFGFPFGSQLGKAVTVTPSAVSSLRNDPNGMLARIQVAGGMNPGNSGGPVVDAWGDVIGVSVAMYGAMGPTGLANTQINFAVPSDYVHAILNGRVTDLMLGQPYREGDSLKVPVTVHLVDPLNRIREVSIDHWLGSNGKPRPATWSEPKEIAGDTNRQSVALELKGRVARGELSLPAAAGSKAYWLQPTYVTRSGAKKWLLGRTYQPPAQVERKAANLELKHAPGAEVPVVLSQRFTLKIGVGSGETHTAVSRFEAKLTEATKAVDEQGTATIHRQYTGLRTAVSLDDQPSPQGHPLAMMQPHINTLTATLGVDTKGEAVRDDVDTSKNGPSVMDGPLANTHKTLQALLQAVRVPLPGKAIQPGGTWKAQRSLPSDLPVPQFVMPGGPGQAGQAPELTLNLTYTYNGLRERSGKTQAVITFAGPARDALNQEANAGRANGTALVDVATGQTVESDLSVHLEVNLPTMTGQAITASATQEVRLRPPAAPTAKK